jgi:tetratricopeptide (TPR) repeat protein
VSGTRLAALLAVALLSGCAALGSRSALNDAADLPTRTELTDTPFFAQAEYQCGPAALATVLQASKVLATPAELVEKVYVPARRGSLQVEMLATIRSSDRVAYVIEPSAGALAREVAAGRPALVLLNLGIDAWPRWHYAVVIGFDRDRDRWILRSGTTRRQTMSMRRFEGAWHRASRWAVVLLDPGAVPATDDANQYAAAVAHFEVGRSPRQAVRAYETGVKRWPSSAVLQFGLSNALLAAGEAGRAEATLQQLLAREPSHVAARNNLAELLGRRGCKAAAAREIESARALAGAGPFAAAIAATRAEIEALPDASAADCPT